MISRSMAFLVAALLHSVSLSRQNSGGGEAFFFDSTATCDAIRISMTNVFALPSGKGLFAWLVSDNDAQYTNLGQLTVQGDGSVSFVYRDNTSRNLIASTKKLLITREILPFTGMTPSLATVAWADSLYGPGVPTPGSPLGHIRNCLSGFSNTYRTLGLADVFKIDSSDYVAHAGFARDGAKGNNVGNARVHSDHVYDFIMGHLTGSVIGNSSVVSHTDPVGYGFRRYWDLGTHDSTQGGAGALGGVGYHVNLAITDPSATPQMIKEGSSVISALRNTFGAQNDSGLARKVTDRAINIVNGNYITGQLVTEGDPFYQLTLEVLRGTVNAADTGSATGGIVQAYHHLQRMATFALRPLLPSGVYADRAVQPPSQYRLYQNFPNPFNPSTEIVFELPVRSRVWLSIYNILGQEIKRLIDGDDFGKGAHSTLWQSEDPSGVYICRLEIADLNQKMRFSAVRRMVLLK